LAFWSEFASAFAAQVHSVCASVTAVYLPFFVFGRVLTRLDLNVKGPWRSRSWHLAPVLPINFYFILVCSSYAYVYVYVVVVCGVCSKEVESL